MGYQGHQSQGGASLRVAQAHTVRESRLTGTQHVPRHGHGAESIAAALAYRAGAQIL